jgi:hypothetical protein
MRVRELIKQLAQMPQEAEVVIPVSDGLVDYYRVIDVPTTITINKMSGHPNIILRDCFTDQSMVHAAGKDAKFECDRPQIGVII